MFNVVVCKDKKKTPNSQEFGDIFTNQPPLSLYKPHLPPILFRPHCEVQPMPELIRIGSSCDTQGLAPVCEVHGACPSRVATCVSTYSLLYLFLSGSSQFSQRFFRFNTAACESVLSIPFTLVFVSSASKKCSLSFIILLIISF